MKLNWRAVVLGAIVDFVGSYFATYMLVLLWVSALRLHGIASDQAWELAVRQPLFLAISVTVSWYFDYLAGKVAASFSDSNGPLHGVVATVPGVVQAIVDALGSDPPPVPLWFVSVGCGVSIGCGYYGGGKASRSMKS